MDKAPREDIMSLLMAFEKKDGSSGYPVMPGQDLDADEMDGNGGEGYHTYMSYFYQTPAC